MTGIDPVRLPSLEWGERGRGRVLLVHGLSSSASVWWRVADRLAAAGWMVVAPDLRGHGRAPRTERYPIQAHAADLVAMGSGWDVVVGHSIGGTAALLASVPRGWARRLVLLDPVLRVDDDDHERITSELLAELDLDAGTLASAHPDWHPEDVHLKVASARATSPYVVERTMEDSRPIDVLPALESVTIPTEILAADPARGAFVDADLVAEVARRVPWLGIRTCEGCGHSILRERPDAVVEAVGTPLG